MSASEGAAAKRIWIAGVVATWLKRPASNERGQTWIGREGEDGRTDKVPRFGAEDGTRGEELVRVEFREEVEDNEALGDVDGALGIVRTDLEDGDFACGVDAQGEPVGLVLEVDLDVPVRGL